MNTTLAMPLQFMIVMTSSELIYITREDAKVLSNIFSRNIAIHDMMALKPVTYAHCVCQELGPLHECTVILHTNLLKRTMSAYLEANNCTFSLH